ncbi:olfactory receptor 6B2-like [Pelobates fuscus]|uniref:olfactory receptor 6B2-like n=1 Tax=Pelobates fuscus TaxID=191477 RepID=UPI002FE4BF09
MNLENRTVIHEFLLLAFSNMHEGKFLLFIFLFLIYLITLIGNLLIIASVYAHLHSPMYFFLSNFSLSEIVFTTNITPNMLFTTIHEGSRISVNLCITQYYTYSVSIWAECLLLAVMSYDRYLAICNPLHYSSVMSPRLCLHLVVWSWFVGFTVPIIEAIQLGGLTYCGHNIIDHFFCDFAPIIQLSCSDTNEIELTDFILSFPIFVFPVLFIIITYIMIIFTILQIPTNTGRKKAFSTCSSHLMVVCIYYGSCIVVYMSPSAERWLILKKVLSLLYTVVTPVINLFIYSIRNKEIRISITTLATKLKRCEIHFLQN